MSADGMGRGIATEDTEERTDFKDLKDLKDRGKGRPDLTFVLLVLWVV
jgi:hypothetical protein